MIIYFDESKCEQGGGVGVVFFTAAAVAAIVRTRARVGGGAAVHVGVAGGRRVRGWVVEGLGLGLVDGDGDGGVGEYFHF